MRFLFFLMAFPIMMMSFFEVSDVVPLAEISLFVDGARVELTETEQQGLNEQVVSLFEGSRTMPCYCVTLHDDFVEEVQSGTYVCLNFAIPLEVNGMPFDQLVFKVDCQAESVVLSRGNHGIFQGRGLCVNLNGKTMQELCNFVDGIDLPEGSEEENETENEGSEEDLNSGEESGETTEQNSGEELSEENLEGGEEILVEEEA